ncbi:MAG: hypothetical protein LUC94_03305 [Clostridiales bacterium]|nr:hypothetical protein [Clostridiales bacterium]
MIDFEAALHRQAYDLVFDFDEFRMSALILESATDSEIAQLRAIAQNIARRYKERKAARS